MVVIDHNESVFEPEAAQAMSHVFDDICASLHIPNSADKIDCEAHHRNRPPRRARSQMPSGSSVA